MLCNLTGSIRDLTGEPFRAGAMVAFERDADAMFGQDGAAVVPERIRTSVGTDGAISIVLYPGQYRCMVDIGNRFVVVQVGVPDAPTAQLDECIDQMPALTPSLVQDVVAMRAEIEGWYSDWLSGGGTGGAPVSANPGNVLERREDGLFVPAPQLSSQKW